MSQPDPDSLGVAEFDPNDERGPGTTLADRIDDAVDRLDQLRAQPLVAAGGLVAIVVLVVAGWWFGRAPEEVDIDALIPQVALQPTLAPSEPPPELIVHVTGAVRTPGVYVLTPEVGAAVRILDAVEAAGGALDGADLDQLNLAAPLVDGVQIRVPAEGEVVAQPVVGVGDGGELGGPLDLNTASAPALDDLPGVGPATAEAIIRWREDSGPFVVVEDLLSVPGIGPAKLDALVDLVVVR